MDTKLKMSVIMAAVDKITAPIKKVTSGTTKLTETMKASKAELDKISNQQKDIAHFKSLKKSISKLKPEFIQQQNLVEKLAAEYESAEKPTVKMRQALERSKEKLAAMNTGLKQNRQELKGVISRLSETGIKTNRLAAHTKKLQQQTDKYNNSLDKTKAKLKALAQHEDRLKAVQSKRAKAMQSASNMAIAGAGMTYASQRTIQGIKDPLNVAANFEAQMSKVQAISKANDEQIKRLSGQSRKLGAETVFAASEVASAQEFLAVAGFDTNKILAATPATLKLAQAGNVDLARAADIASDALTAFNMNADEMGRMADVLALTSTTANTNVNMLGDSLKTSAGVAGSYGGTIEQVSAMLGIMANSGIKASQAGTAISSMYSRIAAPPKEGQRALEELGVSAFDAEGKMRALPNILQDIAEATNGMTDTETAPLFKAIFGAEAGIMAGSKALLQAANNNKLTEYVKQLENSQGTAGKIATKMSDNLTGTVKSWDSAMESMKISAGTALIPTIRELTVWVTGITRKIDKFAQENPNMVKWLGIAAIAFAAITAVLGPLMIMISAIVGAYATLNFALAAASLASTKFNLITGLGSGIMKGFAAAQWLVNAAFAANPIGATIAVIAGLIGLAAWLIDDWGAVGDWFSGLWEKITSMVSGVGDAISEAFSWFGSDQEQEINQTVNRVNGKTATAAATALTASVATMPTMANDNVQVVPANPIAQQQSKQVQIEGDKIEIHLAPTPGMDNQAIAALVRQELEKHQQEKQRRLRGMLND